MKPFQLTAKYILISGIAVLLSFVFHELAHWVAGELLGYKMGMTFNTTTFPHNMIIPDRHEVIVSAAGPLFTILQGSVFYWLLRKYNNDDLYPFLFTAFYIRLLAGAMNFINLNDEGRISKILGIGTYTLSVIVCTILFLLLYKISKGNKYSFKFQLANVLLTICFSSVLILGNQYFHWVIIN